MLRIFLEDNRSFLSMDVQAVSDYRPGQFSQEVIELTGSGITMICQYMASAAGFVVKYAFPEKRRKYGCLRMSFQCRAKKGCYNECRGFAEKIFNQEGSYDK